jgi:hypothetical protein
LQQPRCCTGAETPLAGALGVVADLGRIETNQPDMLTTDFDGVSIDDANANGRSVGQPILINRDIPINVAERDN